MSEYKDMGRSRLIAEIEALSHWRDLALQFDNHRMTALWHLKALLQSREHVGPANDFLDSPPLAAHEVVAERDQLKTENESLRKDAERYRWLRDSSWYIAEDYESCGKSDEALDALIDSAISSPENPS